MDADYIDRARGVRPGEELDLDSLQAYLHAHIPDLAGPLAVEQFPSGFSNLTYLLRAGERELVLRRPPFGANIRSGHDMGREYRILSHLEGHYARVPRPLAYCEDESVLGAPFYVMERVTGVVLRAKTPQGLALTPDVMEGLCRAFVENLVEIHSIDYEAVGLGDLGRPAGYATRQVEGWTRRYHKAQTDDLPDMAWVAGWLAERIPPESGAALIHNDYKYDNLVLDPADLSRIVAVLDWEMATLGDPLMDLGTSLGYWVDPDDPSELQAMAFCPTALPGNLTRRELVERYAEQSGRDVANVLFYYVYALFKVAVIIQQIYARYKHGHTQDARFANLIDEVRVLAQTAVRAVRNGHI